MYEEISESAHSMFFPFSDNPCGQLENAVSSIRCLKVVEIHTKFFGLNEKFLLIIHRKIVGLVSGLVPQANTGILNLCQNN